MPNIQVKAVPLSGTPVRVTPGQSYDMLGGAQAEGIIAQLHGRFYTQLYNRQLWAASITAAAAIPINTTTNGITFAIWNPSGSGVQVVPVAFLLGITGTAGVQSAIGYYFRSGTSADAATGGRVTAFTAVANMPTLQTLGLGYSGVTKVGSAATLDVAGTLARWSQFSQQAPTTNAANSPFALIEWFDGTMGIPPGVLWYPAANAATADTFMQTMVGYEAPWP